MNDYYLKGTDIMQFRVPSTVSWMLNRIVNNRELIDSWNELGNFVVNGKFNTKLAYLSRVLLILSFLGGPFGAIIEHPLEVLSSSSSSSKQDSHKG